MVRPDFGIEGYPEVQALEGKAHNGGHRRGHHRVGRALTVQFWL